MPSRMDRYYKSDVEVKERSRKNEDLYRKIYDNPEYSNIEGIAKIEKNNEIDLTKLKEMLKNREEYQKEKQYRQIVHNEPIQIPKHPEIDEDDDRNYDIRDVLKKAKTERPEPAENPYRRLKNTQYDILKNINIKEQAESYHPPKDYMNEKEDHTDDLKELIHTITNTSLLNKLGDKDLSLDLLSDMKSQDNTIVGNTSSSIRSLLQEEKKQFQEEKEEESSIDKSFYTSSLNFKEDDFEDLKEINTHLKRSNMIIKIALAVLLVIITGIVIFFVVRNFIK